MRDIVNEGCRKLFRHQVLGIYMGITLKIEANIHTNKKVYGTYPVTPK